MTIFAAFAPRPDRVYMGEEYAELHTGRIISSPPLQVSECLVEVLSWIPAWPCFTNEISLYYMVLQNLPYFCLDFQPADQNEKYSYI
jgi:hypothetical protein